MKKKRFIIPLVIAISCVLISMIFILKFHFWEKEENSTSLNDFYIDYVCKDFRLVCLRRGESDGYYNIENEKGSFNCRYSIIEDVSKEQFVFARVRRNTLLAIGSNLVLQHPDNNLDVLRDWTMKEVEIFYVDRNEEENLEITAFQDQSQLITHKLKSTSNESVFKELAGLLSISDEEQNFLRSEIHDNCDKIRMNSVRYYLRIYFEESTSIAWETEIGFFRLKDDTGQIFITLPNATPENEYLGNGFDIQIDPSSELYDLIWDVIWETEE